MAVVSRQLLSVDVQRRNKIHHRCWIRATIRTSVNARLPTSCWKGTTSSIRGPASMADSSSRPHCPPLTNTAAAAQLADDWHLSAISVQFHATANLDPATNLRGSGASVHMGVDHVGGQGDTPPRIWSRGDDNANCPPQILSYKYKNERSVAFKIRQNPFSLCPGPRWGAHDTPPDPLVGWRGNTPPHTLPHSAPIHLRPSPCVPLEFQPDLRLCLCTPNKSGWSSLRPPRD